MKNYKVVSLLTIVLFVFSACGGETDVVESGTYTGTIDEVNADETEIYVETEDGQRLELYFTETTELTQNNQTIPFSDLQQGDRVQVTVEKVGQRLDPISVQLLE